MNRCIVAIAVTAAFAGGVVVGHYAPPRELKVSRQGFERSNKAIADANAASRSSDIPQAGSAEVSTSSLPEESMILAIQDAAAHPANRHLYAEISNLVRKLDAGKIRPVIDAIQAVP